MNFRDTLPTGMVIASPSNASTDCSSQFSPATLIATAGTNLTSLTANGFAGIDPVLGVEESCTVSVDVTASAGGQLENLSDELTLPQPDLLVGRAAAALNVTVDALTLTKSFVDDPVPPGETVTVEFTIQNLNRSEAATSIAFTDDLTFLTDLAAVGLPLAEACDPDATGITFTDNLATTAANLTASGLPLSDVCGTGNGTLTGSAGDTLLTFSGATLTPGETCTFDVTLNTTGVAHGMHENTTSEISATVGGVATTGLEAIDDLILTSLLFSKGYTDDPVAPGGTANLQFTIDNTLGSVAASDITFSDTLDTGLTFGTLPATPCGATSFVAFGGFLTLLGGTVDAGDSCSFDVPVEVDGSVASGTYRNRTGNLSASLGGGSAVELDPAVDDLIVAEDALTFTKEFTDDPVEPGGTATLEFTIQNDSIAAYDATGIEFTDDLNAVLPGLTAVGLPLAEACDPDGPGGDPGTGTLSGTTSLTFSDGVLGPGESCTFSVTVDVPANAPGSEYLNETSEIEADFDGTPFIGDPATDSLDVLIVEPVREPEVVEVVIDDGTGQRSMVRTITVEFNQQVTLDPGAFVLTTAAGVPVSFTENPTIVDGRTVVELDLDGIGGSVADGNYRLRVVKENVSVDGTPMAADRVDDFFRHYGDITGDRTVDTLDLPPFRLTYFKSLGNPLFNDDFDFDGNDIIDTDDLREFRQRYFKTLDPPSP